LDSELGNCKEWNQRYVEEELQYVLVGIETETEGAENENKEGKKT
jgi:hypothetical protein